MDLKEYLAEISIPLYVTVCVFAISSWIDVYGIWVEIPLMVNVLPEGWDLPSYLVVVIQLANVSPLAFTIAKKLAPTKVSDWVAIYIIIGIGVVACFLLVFFWDRTTHIAGKEHSTALLILTGFLGIVDCTSTVVFLPYMALFSSQYLTAYYVGEGLSGLIPSIIGLIQSSGKDPICVSTKDNNTNGTEYAVEETFEQPLFGVNVYFGLMVMLLCTSMLAFTLIHFHPVFKRHRKIRAGFNSPATPVDPTDQIAVLTPADNSTFPFHQGDLPHNDIPEKRDTATFNVSLSDRITPLSYQEGTFSVTNRVVLTQLILVGWMNALTYGVLPSIQSYSTLPYGNLAFDLSVRLSVLVNPLACFVGLFVHVKSTVVCGILGLIGTALSAYQIALAALSPYPPLYDETIGAILAVSTFVLLTAIFSYTRLSLAALLSERGGAKGLLWCGGVTQIGSLIGAVVIFVLINHAKLFTSKHACT